MNKSTSVQGSEIIVCVHLLYGCCHGQRIVLHMALHRLHIAQTSASCVDSTEDNSADTPWQRFLLEVAYEGSKYHGAIAPRDEYPSVQSAVQASWKHVLSLYKNATRCIRNYTTQNNLLVYYRPHRTLAKYLWAKKTCKVSKYRAAPIQACTHITM